MEAARGFALMVMIVLSLSLMVSRVTYAIDMLPINIQNVKATMVDDELKVLTLEIPYQKPHFFLMRCMVKVRIKPVSPDSKPREVVQKRFLWKMKGMIELEVPLDKPDHDWPNSEIMIEQSYSKSRTTATDWFPLAAVIQQVHLQVLAPSKWYYGYEHSVRVIARNSRTGELLTHGSVRASLRHTISQKQQDLFLEKLNNHGSCQPSFDIDNFEPGEYTLTVRVSSDRNFAQIQMGVSLIRKHALVLDCPTSRLISGDRVPIRAYVRTEPASEPLEGCHVTFRVNSPTRKMIDSQSIMTDSTGEAVYWFEYVTGMDPGAYIVSVETPLVQTRHILMAVEREAVLNRLLITTEQIKYCLDDTIRYKVTALFGPHAKPQANVGLHIRLISPFRLAKVYESQWGKTNNQGEYSGLIDLQSLFGNRTLDQIPLKLQIHVTAETKTVGLKASGQTSIELYPDPYRAELVPELPVLVPKVANDFNMALKRLNETYLAGTIMLEGTFEGSPRTVELSDRGPVPLTLVPTGLPFEVAITGQFEQEYSSQVSFDAENIAVETLLIKPIKELEGDQPETLAILSPEQDGFVFIDLIVDDQLMRSLTLRLVNGEARYPLDQIDPAIIEQKPVIVSAYQYTGSLTAKTPLLTGHLYIQSDRLATEPSWSWELGNDVFNAWEEPQVKLSWHGRDREKPLAMWLDYFMPLGAQDPSSGPLTSAETAFGLSKACLVPPELDPTVGFHRTGDDPTGMWRRIQQGQVERKCAYIWQRLPLSLKGNDHLTTETILEQKLLKPDELKDPWGRSLMIDFPGQPCHSLGQDGQDRTGDELYASGSWSLQKTVDADDIQPGKAGLAVTVFDHLSFPAHSVSVRIESEDGSTLSLPQAKHEASFYGNDLMPAEYRITVHGPSYPLMSLENVSLVKGKLSYVRIALPDRNTVSAGNVSEIALDQDDFSSEPGDTAFRTDQNNTDLLFLHSEKRDLAHLEYDSFILSLPDQGEQFAYRGLPVGEGSVYGSRWEMVNILRDFDLDFPKHIKAELEGTVTTELTLTNRTSTNMNLTVSIKAAHWYSTVGKRVQKSQLRPGKSKVFQFKLKPRLRGDQELHYRISTGKAILARTQSWSIAGKSLDHAACGWVLFQPGQAVPLPADHQGTSLSHLVFRFYREKKSFITDFADWVSSPKGNVHDDETIMPCLLRLNCLLTLVSRDEPWDGSSEKGPDDRDKIVTELRKLYQRLLFFQTGRGGYAYTREGLLDPVLSALVLRTLDQVSHLITIDQKSYRNTRFWLLSTQNEEGIWMTEPMENALIVWSLASAKTGIENINRTLRYYASQSRSELGFLAEIVLSQTARLIDSHDFPSTILDQALDLDGFSDLDRLWLSARLDRNIPSPEQASQLIDYLQALPSHRDLNAYCELFDYLVRHFEALHLSAVPTDLIIDTQGKQTKYTLKSEEIHDMAEVLVSIPHEILEAKAASDHVLFSLSSVGPVLACYCFQSD
ncbi:terpene cyclase/mutase family protein [bacterium]|nr:terpene cyclase/mutase family protein [bacterium]